MDYYLIHGSGGATLVLAEEFLRRNDFTTAGLRSSDASLSRLVRADPGLSAAAVSGEQAGGPLPLHDYEEFPAAPMLALNPAEPLPGFREKRLYRVLFARTPVNPPPDGELVEGGDRYSWTLRRIAGGVAWGLDLTAHLNHGPGLGPLLDRLTDEMRLRHGLIPVTTDRFQ